MPEWSRVRLRTLLLLVAAVAIGPGLYLSHLRREERRRSLPYAILQAAERGDVRRIGLLLDEGADINATTDRRGPWTPLMTAAFSGKADAARFLLERGADPNRHDLDFDSAITIAASRGHWDIVRLLVEHGADPSKGDWGSNMPLVYAKAQGATEMVRYLEAKWKPPGGTGDLRARQQRAGGP